ncbi:AP endonuclease 1 [Strigomonas culicis]|uniref:DNA-(apurinic or apyrimidinic site) endonuclease n=1 Tax=Strigomonas culicis TaxID=28005 RepID=S9UJ67_9TRYP|nr:AP endonuclease 1 [Strigomonas culicis]|eukprot:EPY30867.1 AP endonuclease 1 [Strigomonas culicis]
MGAAPRRPGTRPRRGKPAAARRRTKSPPTPPGDAPAKVIGNRVSGPVKRSPAALVALSEKKSKESIWDAVEPFKRQTSDSQFDAAQMLKFITWNVAGLRGMLKKDEKVIANFLKTESPDVLCLQETKLNVGDEAANDALGVVEGYTFADHPCRAKKGYSGTRTYIKTSSMLQLLHAHHTRGFHLPGQGGAAAASGDAEGRVLSTFFNLPGRKSEAALPALAIINTYVPNSGMTLDRLPYRTQEFDAEMRTYLADVARLCHANGAKASGAAAPPVGGFIWTGDLNVAERDFDRYYSGTFKTMQDCSGFTPEERWSFRETLKKTDAVDTFRHFYPNAGPAYTFWSARLNGRAKGLGWRLDYFVVSANLAPSVVDCFPMQHVMGSDHCPVQMWLRKS